MAQSARLDRCVMQQITEVARLVHEDTVLVEASFYLRSMICHSLLHDLMLALVGSAKHSPCSANTGMREIASSSNLLVGVYHHDQLVELVSQHACDVAQQGGLACQQQNGFVKGQ